MKTIVLVAANLILSGSNVSAQQVRKLFRQERFFELSQCYETAELPKYKKLYYRAYLDNVFGRLKQSNGVIDNLFTKYQNKLKARERAELLLVKSDNYTKQYEYAKSAEVLQQILANYSKKIDKKSKKDIKNSFKLWHALSGVPGQIVHHLHQTEVPIMRNQFNHWTIPVSCQTGETIQFVFDSGANLSTIRKGIAAQMGVVYTGSKIDVGNSVGTEIQAEYGYIPKLSVGDLVVENVVVLVMPDQTLTFEQIGYKIDGIIGFPVIQGFGEFSISNDGMLRIAVSDSRHDGHNLFTKGLTPYVHVEFNDEPLTMIFDTGALNSQLSSRYYKSHKSFVKANSTKVKTRVGGAGGVKDIENRELRDVTFTVAGHEVTTPKINVFNTKLFRDGKNDGFLGQDMLMQPRETVMNFRDMYLFFRN